jgi:hypothetical protein
MNCPHCGRDANQPALLLAARPKRGTLPATLRRMLRDCGPQGLTVEDLTRLTRVGHQSVSARVHDLWNRGELDCVGERATSTGRTAHAFVLKPAPEGFER